jgi:hypothetical protein
LRKRAGEGEEKEGRRMRKEDRVRERPVTIVEEIEGKEMQKETEVERLAGPRVEGRNNSSRSGSGGFGRALID